MAEIKDRYTFGWFGIGVDSQCEDFSFYNDDDESELKPGFENVAEIQQSSGTSTDSWTRARDVESRGEWLKNESFFTAVMGWTQKDYIKQLQDFTGLVCGHPYLIRLTAEAAATNIGVDIPGFQPSYHGNDPAGTFDEVGSAFRIEKDEPPCPTGPECECNSHTFTFRKIWVEETKYWGWQKNNLWELCEGQIASGEPLGFDVTLFYAGETLEVETELFFDEHSTVPDFSIARELDPWVWSETTNKFYRLEDTKIVEIVDCPSLEDVDCVKEEWTNWGSCLDDEGVVQTCGNGHTRTKIRTIAIEQKNNGTPCEGPFEQVESCDDILPECPIICVVSEWSPEWTPCSQECDPGTGPGTQKKSRTVLVQSANGAPPCPELDKFQDCGTTRCEIPCVVSEWVVNGDTDDEGWSDCDEDCGPGHQKRVRTVLVESQFGAPDCPALEEIKDCQIVPCPVPCVVSDWIVDNTTTSNGWGPCSQACDDVGGSPGSRSRTRTVVTQSQFGAPPCPDLVETQECGTTRCEIPCVVSDWIVNDDTDDKGWEECSQECDNRGGSPGTQKRTRTVETQPQFTNVPCPSLEEFQDCGADRCPILCVVSDWTRWSDCSKSCDDGNGLPTQTRTRTMVSPPMFTDIPCPELRQEQTCNTDPCPPEPCVVSDWIPEWSPCSQACDSDGSGPGTQKKTRTVISQPKFGAPPCPELEKSQDCGIDRCPIPCVVSGWSPEWTPCSQECDADGSGPGTQKKTRTVITDPQFGAPPCPDLEKFQDCGETRCPIDCVVSEWEGWTNCEKGGEPHECDDGAGPGTQTNKRTVITDAQFNGEGCPKLNDSRSCGTDACPEWPCEVGAWTSWSGCSKTCGTGEKIRTRSITLMPSSGKLSDCPELLDSQECNTQVCPIDCEGNWSQWGDCTNARGSVDCGGGTQTATFEVTRTHNKGVNSTAKNCAQIYGAVALADGGGVKTQSCNTDPCPPVSVGCGVTRNFAGVAGTHSYTVTLGTDLGRVPVMLRPKNNQTSTFKVNWNGAWVINTSTNSDKNLSFIKNTTKATALIVVTNTNTLVDWGVALGCPQKIDCVEGSWGTWGPCKDEDGHVKTCGPSLGYTRSRTRSVTTQPVGGTPCVTVGTEVCDHLPLCDVDCEVGAWGTWTTCSEDCDGGTQTAHRTVTKQKVANGADCPSLKRLQTCNTDCCPKCEVSAWSGWSGCPDSAPCEEVSETRERTITTRCPSDAECPSLEQSRKCVYDDKSCFGCNPDDSDCRAYTGEGGWEDATSWDTGELNLDVPGRGGSSEIRGLGRDPFQEDERSHDPGYLATNDATYFRREGYGACDNCMALNNFFVIEFPETAYITAVNAEIYANWFTQHQTDPWEHREKEVSQLNEWTATIEKFGMDMSDDSLPSPFDYLPSSSPLTEPNLSLSPSGVGDTNPGYVFPRSCYERGTYYSTYGDDLSQPGDWVSNIILIEPDGVSGCTNANYNMTSTFPDLHVGGDVDYGLDANKTVEDRWNVVSNIQTRTHHEYSQCSDQLGYNQTQVAANCSDWRSISCQMGTQKGTRSAYGDVEIANRNKYYLPSQPAWFRQKTEIPTDAKNACGGGIPAKAIMFQLKGQPSSGWMSGSSSICEDPCYMGMFCMPVGNTQICQQLCKFPNGQIGCPQRTWWNHRYQTGDAEPTTHAVRALANLSFIEGWWSSNTKDEDGDLLNTKIGISTTKPQLDVYSRLIPGEIIDSGDLGGDWWDKRWPPAATDPPPAKTGLLGDDNRFPPQPEE
jgi:hypothetical protein